MKLLSLSVVSLAALALVGCEGKVGGNAPRTVGGGGSLGNNPAAKNESSVILAFDGNAADAPPPAIAKPLSRFSYRVMSSTAPGEGSEWKPNDQGYWENTRTGQRYDRTKKEGGGSSDTIEQYDVLILDNQRTLMLKTTFMISPNLGDPAPSGPLMYMEGTAGLGNAIWANTDTLQSISPFVEPTRRVTKGQLPVGDGTRDAISFWQYDEKVRSTYSYDLGSGLLLQYDIFATGNPSAMTAPGETNTGSTTIIAGFVVGSRQISLPWAGAPDPDWAKSLKTLTYDMSSQFSLGGPAPLAPTNSKVRFTVKERGDTYTLLERQVIATDGPDMTLGRPSPYYNTSNKPDPLWIAPDVLARLQSGQTLDQDPVTKTVIRVGNVQQGPRGQFVEIIHANSATEARCGYDLKTGCMVSLQKYDPVQHTTIKMALSGSE